MTHRPLATLYALALATAPALTGAATPAPDEMACRSR